MAKSKLAALAASVSKSILGADLPKPETVAMPKAVHELHVSPSEMIPAGTVITPEIAKLAGFDDDTIEDLAVKGAIVMVDVLASAIAAPAEA